MVYDFEVQFAIRFPQRFIKRWTIWVPIPPDCPKQNLVGLECSPGRWRHFTCEVTSRRFIRATFNGKEPPYDQSLLLTISGRIAYDQSRRWFGPNVAATTAWPSQATLGDLLNQTAWVDYEHGSVQQLIGSHSLRRLKGESRNDFVARLADKILVTFRYERDESGAKRASDVARKGWSDSTGLGTFIVACLRNSAIPSSLLGGFLVDNATSGVPLSNCFKTRCVFLNDSNEWDVLDFKDYYQYDVRRSWDELDSVIWWQVEPGVLFSPRSEKHYWFHWIEGLLWHVEGDGGPSHRDILALWQTKPAEI